MLTVTLRCSPQSAEPRRATAEALGPHFSSLALVAPQDDGNESSSRRLFDHRHPVMAKAAEAGAAAADEIADAFDAAKTACQLLQRHLRFHAGQRISGAGVNAAAARQGAIWVGPDFDTTLGQ